MLLILTTHPIQYQVPIWRLLAERGKVPFRVVFMSRHGLEPRLDPGFGEQIAWNSDLLSGYPHEFFPAIESAKQTSRNWLRLDQRFLSLLREQAATVLWVQGWQVAAYWQAVSYAKRLGIPVWLRGESNPRSRSEVRLKFAKDVLLRNFFSKIDRFLQIGSLNGDLYSSFGIRSDQLTSAPYCVENGRFRRAAEMLKRRRAALREQWGIPHKAICVLFVGKLIPKKRPLDLVEAIRLLKQERPDLAFHLVFVGSGELSFRLRQQTNVLFDRNNGGKQLQLSDKSSSPSASFLGFVNQTELPETYAIGDLLVLPSEATETWGLVVNEAMASGRPAIVSDMVGCGPDLVAPLNPKFVFPFGDVVALSESLAEFVEHPPAETDIASLINRFDPLVTVETVERLFSEQTSVVAGVTSR